jgi:hypothetical protein
MMTFLKKRKEAGVPQDQAAAAVCQKAQKQAIVF